MALIPKKKKKNEIRINIGENFQNKIKVNFIRIMINALESKRDIKRINEKKQSNY